MYGRILPVSTGVSATDRVRIDQSAVFAEEVLAEFMPLVNVAAYYANLSYGYLDESSAQELAEHGIHFDQHLRFETS